MAGRPTASRAYAPPQQQQQQQQQYIQQPYPGQNPNNPYYSQQTNWNMQSPQQYAVVQGQPQYQSGQYGYDAGPGPGPGPGMVYSNVCGVQQVVGNPQANYNYQTSGMPYGGNSQQNVQYQQMYSSQPPAAGAYANAQSADVPAPQAVITDVNSCFTWNNNPAGFPAPRPFLGGEKIYPSRIPQSGGTSKCVLRR